MICANLPLFRVEETEAQRGIGMCPTYVGLILTHSATLSVTETIGQAL